MTLIDMTQYKNVLMCLVTPFVTLAELTPDAPSLMSSLPRY